MLIKFLGTGGSCGVPFWNCDCRVCKSKNPKDQRLRSVLFIKIGDKNIAIDGGPDFRTQLLKYKIKKLDYVFLTHAHGDHINGSSEFSKQPNLIVETPTPVLKEFYVRIGPGKDWLMRRNPSMIMQNFSKKIIGGVTVDTVKLDHGKDNIDKPTPCFGYVFRSEKFSFAYLTDYSAILEPKKLKNLDLIISDGCNLEAGHGHAGVEGSIKVYNDLRPKKMLLTHLNHHSLYDELSKKLKKVGNIGVAYDGLEIKC